MVGPEKLPSSSLPPTRSTARGQRLLRCPLEILLSSDVRGGGAGGSRLLAEASVHGEEVDFDQRTAVFN